MKMQSKSILFIHIIKDILFIREQSIILKCDIPHQTRPSMICSSCAKGYSLHIMVSLFAFRFKYPFATNIHET